MKIRKRQFSIVLVAIFTMLFLNVNCVSAADERQLVGELISVDSFSKIAVVDVKTEGCQKINEFKIDDPRELDGLIEKKISFYIDSTTCKRGKVYKMYKVRLRRGEIR